MCGLDSSKICYTRNSRIVCDLDTSIVTTKLWLAFNSINKSGLFLFTNIKDVNYVTYNYSNTTSIFALKLIDIEMEVICFLLCVLDYIRNSRIVCDLDISIITTKLWLAFNYINKSGLFLFINIKDVNCAT